MEYRSFGGLNWKVSALGFGTMRLPVINENQSMINELETIALIRYAAGRGINYIDTAFTYHDGNSEVIVGKALSGKYRNKVKIATKMPVSLVNRKEDLDNILSLQMARLKTNYIDFYLFHSLTKQLWNKVKKLKMLKWAEKQIAKKRIGYLGFSFHDEFEVFKEIIDEYDKWTLSQIQYNYLNENYQAGKAGLRYAYSKGLAVAIMEPLAGGLLSITPPLKIKKEWNTIDSKRSAAEWALQWVWNHHEVSVALSGMNAMQQVVENIESANRSGNSKLSSEEIDIIAKARELFLEYGHIGCTTCRYCNHCPQSIDIPNILTFLNKSSAKNLTPREQSKLKEDFALKIPSDRRGNSCIRCGKCEAICPQHLPIRKLLSEATSTFQ